MRARRLLLLTLCTALGLPASGEESERLKAFRMAFAAPDPAAKAAAVKALAASWDAEVAGTLLPHVKPSQDPEVLASIAAAAGKHPDAGATALLKAALSLAPKASWRARGTAAMALLSRNAPGDFELALGTASDKDDRALFLLCEGLGASRHAQAVPELKRLLAHDDWRVRASALEGLKTQGKSDEVLRALISRLPYEDGRLLGDLLETLKHLTGQDPGPGYAAWQEWFVRSRRGGEGAAVRNAEEAFTHRGTPVTYHGVTTYSRRILFVFDRTGSMTTDDRIGKEKQKLIEVLETLGKPPQGEDRYEKKKVPPVCFNILMFSNGMVESWQPALVPANEESRKAAILFVRKQVPSGWTNTWTAMKTALDMASCGTGKQGLQRPEESGPGRDMDEEPYGYGKQEADTLFLLSDGAPTKPSGQEMDDWQKIADQIRDYNRTKKVVIHTIAIGDALPAFMMRVAQENGGTSSSIP